MFMSDNNENSFFGKVKGIILGVLFIFVTIYEFVLKPTFDFVENNPLTFGWMLAVIGVGVWFFLNRNNPEKPHEPPSKGDDW